MYYSVVRGKTFHILRWLVYFVWTSVLTSRIIYVQGLRMTTLQVCGGRSNQIKCPENKLIVIGDVNLLIDAICKQSFNCPTKEDLKNSMIQECFKKSSCDITPNTDACVDIIGKLAVETACVSDIMTGCMSGEQVLSANSEPVILITPGYPNKYNVTSDCVDTITFDTGVTNGQVTIVDKQLSDVQIYICGSVLMVDFHFHYKSSACRTLNRNETFQEATTFRFYFYEYTAEQRGVLLEVNADGVTGNNNVPALLEIENASEDSDSFFTPLIIVGITAGAAFVSLVIILISAALCSCCCCKRRKTRTLNEGNTSQPSQEKSNSTGVEAFFAGAKAEGPYIENKNVRTQSTDSQTRNGSRHIYENTSSVKTVTVIADIHRENSRPKSKKKPIKTPRKAKRSSTPLQPIYENQSIENGTSSPGAYQNVSTTN